MNDVSFTSHTNSKLFFCLPEKETVTGRTVGRVQTEHDIWAVFCSETLTSSFLTQNIAIESDKALTFNGSTTDIALVQDGVLNITFL